MKAEEYPLPDFLYYDQELVYGLGGRPVKRKVIRIGFRGDSECTEEWYNWLNENVIK